MSVVDEKLRDWLGASRSCDCGQTHTVETKTLFESPLPEAVRRVVEAHRRRGPVVVGMDSHSATAAGNAAIDALKNLGCEAISHVFDAHHGGLVIPDEDAVESIARTLQDTGAHWVLGVGSGTVNDLCKYAASEAGLEYVACPTAASMNGYTSTIAALKRGGLKVTVPCRPPVAVALDPDVQCGAPAILSAAGFADLMSKYVCNADWLLAHIVEGGYHCRVPFDLASAATDEVARHARGVADGDPDTIALLSKALLLSGVAMAVAGSSAPASGGEHLLSHYWEMMIPGCGQGKRYHGTQVGIGILVCATLYQRLADLEPHDINPDAVADQIPTWESLEARLREQFGTVADAVVEQARRKYHTPEQAKAKAADIAGRWPDIWNRLRGILRSADQVRDLLETAGAPTTITALGLELCDLRRALGLCRHIRDRYTVLDFAADIGRWTEADQLAVLEQSGTLK